MSASLLLVLVFLLLHVIWCHLELLSFIFWLVIIRFSCLLWFCHKWPWFGSIEVNIILLKKKKIEKVTYLGYNIYWLVYILNDNDDVRSHFYLHKTDYLISVQSSLCLLNFIIIIYYDHCGRGDVCVWRLYLYKRNKLPLDIKEKEKIKERKKSVGLCPFNTPTDTKR